MQGIRITERGVEFKGGSLHDGFGRFDGFGGSGGHPTLLLLVLQNTAQGGNRGGFAKCLQYKKTSCEEIIS